MLCCSWLISGFDVSNVARRRHVGVDDDAGQTVERELCPGYPVDGDVAKALEREVRLVDLGTAAFQRVPDRRFARAQVLGVEVALLVEHLGVAKRHGRARGALHLETHPADHVLPHVDDGVAGGCLEDFDRLDLLDPPHRWPGRRDEVVLAALHDLHAVSISHPRTPSVAHPGCSRRAS